MAQSVSHSHGVSSTSSLDYLPTLSVKALERAATLRKLAADLERHDDSDLHGDARICDTIDEMLNGSA